MTAQSDHYDGGGSRVGAIPGGGACVGLADPWVLWDSRLHDGTTVNRITGKLADESDGNGDDLVNAGIGPLGEWDLEVRAGRWATAGFYFQAAKLVGGTGLFASLGNAPFPADWDSLGGNPCDGGGFTVMVAIGEYGFQYDVDETGVVTFDRYDGWLETEILVYGGTAADVDLSAVGIGALEDFAGVHPDPVLGGFVEMDVPWQDGLLNLPGVDPTGAHFASENTLWTIHIDPMDRRAYAWRNADLVIRETWEDDAFFTSFSGAGKTCLDSFDPSGVIAQLFAYFGQVGPYPDVFPGLGVGYNPCKGFAFYRGCVPTQDDMDAAVAYWFPGGDQPIRTIRYDVSRGNLLGTAAHGWDLVVPAGYTVAGVGIRCAGATTVGFRLDVVPGDVLRLELGGYGGSDGSGGWPDGGTSGRNTAYGGAGVLAGYGGQGSTRVFLNGVLMAHLAGGGGQAARFRKTTLARDVTPDHPGGAPPNIVVSDNGRDATGVNGGDGATTAAPGAGGPAGGVAGVGNNGGDGPDSSMNDASYWYSGGAGGGGGLFGGGSGGGVGTFAPGGGGGGSHWFHANCRDLVRVTEQPTSSPTANAVGEVLLGG